MKKTPLKSYGKLVYKEKSVVLFIDQGIYDLYYSLIPKYYYANRQKHKPHLTVVRNIEYGNLDKDKLGYMENNRVSFKYDTEIKFSHPYFFLECYSKEIEGIRKILGLSSYRKGFNCYHITIGNIK